MAGLRISPVNLALGKSVLTKSWRTNHGAQNDMQKKATTIERKPLLPIPSFLRIILKDS
jgi:hypothetical protein